MIFENLTRVLASVLSTWHQLTQMTNLGRGHLSGENAPTRLHCKEVYRIFSWLMWKGLLHCGRCHCWVGGAGMYKKAVWASYEGEGREQPSSVALASVSDSTFLPWFPALTSFCDGLLPGSVSWNKPFPPLVMVMVFHHSSGTLTKTAGPPRCTAAADSGKSSFVA